MYRVITYYSLRGLVRFIDLGDQAYGEWIVYDNLIPKYHVRSFNSDSPADAIIGDLITKKKETIQSILVKINIKQGTKLSLGYRPSIEIIKKSALLDLQLPPLPESFIKEI